MNPSKNNDFKLAFVLNLRIRVERKYDIAIQFFTINVI